MKATVDRATFAAALKTAGRHYGQRVTLPALSGVLIVAEHNTVEIHATDLTSAALLTLDADVHDPGRTLVPLRALTRAVGTDGDPTVGLALDDERLNVDLGDATVALRPMTVEDFPRLAGPSRGPTGMLGGDDVQTLARVASAAGHDEYRPVLTGLLLDGREALATDSYRAHVGTIGDVGGTALIPADVAVKLAKLAADGPVAVTVEEGQVTFAMRTVGGPKKRRWGFDVRVTTKIIEGTPPNIRALMPSRDEGVPTTVDSKTLAAKVKRVAQLAGGVANVPVMLTSDGARMTVQAQNQEVGEATATLPTDGLFSNWPAWAANPTFLLGSLAAVGDGPVTITGRDSLKPFLLDGDGSVSALVMPMRVS